MRYQFDHDFHVHSSISPCSHDPQQTPANILKYAEENQLRQIVMADHFWDTAAQGDREHIWKAVPFEAISSVLPLPQGENTQYLFGCETDLDMHLRLGISPERMAQMDFIIIPTTHMHMRELTLTPEDGASVYSRAKAWVKRSQI